MRRREQNLEEKIENGEGDRRIGKRSDIPGGMPASPKAMNTDSLTITIAPPLMDGARGDMSVCSTE